LKYKGVRKLGSKERGLFEVTVRASRDAGRTSRGSAARVTP
jgi:hypothetical protein